MTIRLLHELEPREFSGNREIAVVHHQISRHPVLIEGEAHLIARQLLARTIVLIDIKKADRYWPRGNPRKLGNGLGRLRRQLLRFLPLANEAYRLEHFGPRRAIENVTYVARPVGFRGRHQSELMVDRKDRSRREVEIARRRQFSMAAAGLAASGKLGRKLGIGLNSVINILLLRH